MRIENKIFLNTGINYIRIIISAITGIYSTRIILIALGSADYGIFNIVTNLIGLLSVISSTMTASSLRYITYSVGLKDTCKSQRVFASSLIIHIILAVVLFLIFEITGNYLVENQLRIDSNRIYETKILLHLVIITTTISIISVPYDSLILAHENVLFNTAIGIIESLLKILIALYLSESALDKLILYGILLVLSAILIRTIKGVYCHRKYIESRVKISSYEKQYVKDIFSFASWNLIGVVVYVLKNQGISVMLNLFFNTLINAAYGVAAQLNGQLSVLSGAMTQSIQPQIIKSKAAEENTKFLNLSLSASKYAFLLFSLFALPLSLLIKPLLSIWLGKVPLYTWQFSVLLFILTALTQFSVGVTLSAHANGTIKKYQIYSSPIQILSLPIGYFMLWSGLAPYYIIAAYILIEIFVLPLNILYFCHITECTFSKYINDVVVCFILPIAITLGLYAFYVSNFHYSFYKDIMVVAILMIIYTSIFFITGTNKTEKNSIISFLTRYVNTSAFLNSR